MKGTTFDTSRKLLIQQIRTIYPRMTADVLWPTSWLISNGSNLILANWNRRECLFIILLFVILTGADLHLVLMASFRQIQIVTSICRADCCQHEPGVLCKTGAGSTWFCKSRPLHLNLIGTFLSVWYICIYMFFCCPYCTITKNLRSLISWKLVDPGLSRDDVLDLNNKAGTPFFLSWEDDFLGQRISWMRTFVVGICGKIIFDWPSNCRQ